MVSDTAPARTSPPFLDKPTMKRLLLARAYGMSDEKIAEEFGWTVDELRAHAEGLRRGGQA